MIYKDRQELLKALSNAQKGDERYKILSIEQNRNLIKSSGANVMLYSGTIRHSANPLLALENFHVGIIQRLNSKTSEPDGIGALGGLSERTNEQYFNTLSETQKKQLLGKKDDIVIKNGKISLTDDIDIIRINNVLRETKEELGNLGIYNFNINPEQIQLIDMNDVKDDNFAINIWNGKGDVWCITPYCHILETTEQTLDLLVKRSKDISLHESNSEVAQFNKIKLTQALTSFGNHSGNHRLEDGRNAHTDYRYPHEWLASWRLASDLLNNNDEKMLTLYRQLQSKTAWKISFKNAAQKMGKDLNFIAKTLKIHPITVKHMEQFTNSSILHNKNNRSV